MIGSHNSWSYLTPKKWWMKLLRFTAKCQEVDIVTQYEQYNVKCFDLRVRWDKDNNLVIAHGLIEYNITQEELEKQLDYINSKKDCYVRVVNEIRTKSKATSENESQFIYYCNYLENKYPNIKFWCGKILYKYKTLYNFKYCPTYCEQYCSVCPPKLIDDWYPKRFAKKQNKKIIANHTNIIESNTIILLIDFINIK